MHIFCKVAKNILLPLTLFFVIVLSYHCGVKPGDYIRKARKALENEDTSKAVFYFQKAYESSLADHFFLLSRDDQFSQIKVSSNRRNIVLVQPSEKISYFIYKRLHDDGDSDEIKESLEGEIKYSYISSNGRYVLFVVSETAKLPSCSLMIWKAIENEFIKTIHHLNCEDRPAISSDGVSLFMQKGQIWYWKDSGVTKLNVAAGLWVKQIADKPLKNQRAKAFFAFSPQGSPFMTYGIAGIYKLYDLRNHHLNLLTKKTSHYKIFFMPKKPYPGVIVGGASQQKLTFFHHQYSNRVIKTYNIPVLQDISFKSESEYYFIDSGRLYRTQGKDSVALPFFAKNIFVNDAGGVFLLSSLGTPLRYEGVLPNKLSQNIFTKTLDIEESR